MCVSSYNKCIMSFCCDFFLNSLQAYVYLYIILVCPATANSAVDPRHVSKGFLSRVALADWNSRRIARRWFFFFLFDSWVIEILHLEHRLCENFEKCFRMVDTSDTRRLLRTCMLRVILC